MSDKQVVIEHNLEKLDWDELEEIFQRVGWKSHTKEKLQKSFRESYSLSLAFAEGKVVGCGRAISDGVFYAAIYDVVIHPDYQGQSIGKMIVSDLMAALKDMPFVHLTSTTGNEPFYHKLGLRKHKTAMARYLDQEKANEYLED